MKRLKIGDTVRANGTVDAIGGDGSIRVAFHTVIGQFTAYFDYAEISRINDADAVRIQKAKADYLTRLIESERADHDGSHTECLRCAIVCEYDAIK